MKKGGALPSNKGASKAGMQSKQGRNFLLPKEEKPKRPKRPKRPKPLPRPLPRPEFGPRPRPKPMPLPRPDRRLLIEDNLRDLLKKKDRKKAIPLVTKKDGGEMKSLQDLFSKPASQGFSKEKFKKALETASFSGVGVSLEKLKKAFEQAKKMKPTGRINMDDIKSALGMMGAAGKGAGKGLGSSLLKKSEPKIKGRLGGPKTSPKRRTKPFRKLI